jgi:UDP-2,3-diacylglucosamine hydrolase
MIYFASDFHLGMPQGEVSKLREKKICDWLEKISTDASEIYLLGDLFDFWFEYKYVVPRGYVRFLGKLAELTDKGIKIFVCVGNHDLWMREYLEEECGVIIFKDPMIKKFGTKNFFIHHGDGLGPGDNGYKFLKKFFLSKINQFLFARLHPNFGFKLANGFSKKSRLAQPEWEGSYQGNDKEYLYQHCLEILKSQAIDFFIFVHRHLKINVELENANPLTQNASHEKSRYINLGEWFSGGGYAKFDGEQLFYYDL